MTTLKQNSKDKQPVVLFQCSPSLGALDSWLSVLKVLRSKLPNVHFIFLSSKLGTIDQVYLESDLIKISEEIFDSIVFRSDSGIFLIVNTFSEAKKLNISSRIKVFHYGRRVLNKFKLKFLEKFIHLPYKVVISSMYSNNIFKISSLKSLNYVTLFDIYELTKPYNKDLYTTVSSSQNFSILHGTGLTGIQTNLDYKLKEVSQKANTANSTAYLFSNNEIPFYEEYYSLTSEQIKVYGIPKHEKQWVEDLASRKTIRKDGRYIFIISRPTNEYITTERRIEFLEMIKKIAIKYQLEVVVKLHPKELKSKLYKQVFDSDEDGIEWGLSIEHPFTLGMHCEFAISYYSGVPLDLLSLGVPTIELSNFIGIDHDDHEHSLRNCRGEAVREYRYLNLVLGASTYDEFEKHVIEILNDKEKVIKELRSNYRKIFPVTKNINNIIADEIKNTII